MSSLKKYLLGLLPAVQQVAASFPTPSIPRQHVDECVRNATATIGDVTSTLMENCEKNYTAAYIAGATVLSSVVLGVGICYYKRYLCFNNRSVVQEDMQRNLLELGERPRQSYGNNV